jgi:predicted outer membrane protein
MRRHLITALLLMAPYAGMAVAQDSTTQTRTQSPDSMNMKQQQPNDRWGGTQSDEAVLMHMHRINQMEIRAGQLAQRNGSSAKVKQFGARLARDHAAADQKVIAAGTKLGITITRGEKMEARGQQRDSSMYSTQRDSTNRYNNQRDSANYRPGYNQSGDSANAQAYDSTGHDGMRGEDRGREEMQRLSTLHGAAFDSAFVNAMAQGHDKAITMLERAQGQLQHQELRTLITNTLPTLRQHLQIAQSLGGRTEITTSSSQQ